MATPVVDLTADLKLQNPTTAERQIREFERRVLQNLKFGNGQPLGKLTAKVTEFDKSMEAANARVVAFGASATVIAGVTASIREMVAQSLKVEKTLADINVLLGQSSGSLAKFSDSLFAIARNTGQSFDSVAEAAKEFSRQGLSVAETLKRTQDALILTRLSGLDAAKAVDTLTASVNAFAKEGLDTTQIVNRLANVDAKFAVSSKDLSEALARAGASAQDAGVSFNELISLVTAVQQRTAAGGAKIGNALKSIFTRTQRSDTLDQFEQLGIAVRDVSGKTLPAVQILSQLAKAYGGLTDAQRAATSELVGGVYQINIVKSLFGDLGQVVPEYSRALDVANKSTDEAIQRNAELNKTLATLANSAQQNFTKLAASFGKVVFGPSLERIFGAFNDFSDQIDGEGIGEKIGMSLLKGIGSALSGPGLVIGAVLGGKLLANFVRFATEALGSLTGVGKASERIQNVQSGINNLMREVPSLQDIILSKTISQAEKEAAILAVIRAQTVARAELANATARTAVGLVGGGNLNYNPRSGNFRGRNVAAGYVPTSSLPPQAIANEVSGAKKAGYIIRPTDVRAMKTNIQGKMTTVVYNNKEKVIHDFAGSGEPAIIPPTGRIQNFPAGYMKMGGFNVKSGGYDISRLSKTSGALSVLEGFLGQVGVKKGSLPYIEFVNNPEILGQFLAPGGKIKGGIIQSSIGGQLYNAGARPTREGLEGIMGIPALSRILDGRIAKNVLHEGYHAASLLTGGAAESRFRKMADKSFTIPKNDKEALAFIAKESGFSLSDVKEVYGAYATEEALARQFPRLLGFAGGGFNLLAALEAMSDKPELLGEGSYRRVYDQKDGTVLSKVKTKAEMLAKLEEVVGVDPSNKSFINRRFLKEVKERPLLQKRLEKFGGPKVHKINKDGSFIADKIGAPTLADAVKSGMISKEKSKELQNIMRDRLIQGGISAPDISPYNIAYSINTGKLIPLDAATGYMPTIMGAASGYINAATGFNLAAMTKSELLELSKQLGISDPRLKKANSNDAANIIRNSRQYRRFVKKEYSRTGDAAAQSAQVSRTPRPFVDTLGFSPIGPSVSPASRMNMQSIPYIPQVDPYQQNPETFSTPQIAGVSAPQTVSQLRRNQNEQAILEAQRLREVNLRKLRSKKIAEYQMRKVEQRAARQLYKAGAITSTNQAVRPFQDILQIAPDIRSTPEGQRNAVKRQMFNELVRSGVAPVDAIRQTNANLQAQAEAEARRNAPAPLSRTQRFKDAVSGGLRRTFTYSDPAKAARFSNYGFAGGAIAFAGGAAGGMLATPNDPLSASNRASRAVSGAANAIGTGAAIASVGGPAGLVIGGVIAAFGTLKSILDNLNPSLEDMQENLTKQLQTRETEVQNITQLRGVFNSLKQEGLSETQRGSLAFQKASLVAQLTPAQRAELEKASNKDEAIERIQTRAAEDKGRFQAAGEASLALKAIAEKGGKGNFFSGYSSFNFSNQTLENSFKSNLSKSFDSSLLQGGDKGAGLKQLASSLTAELGKTPQINGKDANFDQVSQLFTDLLRGAGVSENAIEEQRKTLEDFDVYAAAQATKVLGETIKTFLDVGSKEYREATTAFSQLSSIRLGALEREHAILRQIAQLNFAEKLRDALFNAMEGMRASAEEGLASRTNIALDGAGDEVSGSSRRNMQFALRYRGIQTEDDSRARAIQNDLRGALNSVRGQAGELFARPDTGFLNADAARSATQASKYFRDGGLNETSLGELEKALNLEIDSKSHSQEEEDALRGRLEAVKSLRNVYNQQLIFAEQQLRLNAEQTKVERNKLEQERKLVDDIARRKSIGSLFDFNKLLEGKPDVSSIRDTTKAQNQLFDFRRNYATDGRRFTADGRIAQREEFEASQIAAGRGIAGQFSEGFALKTDQVKALLEQKGELKKFSDFNGSQEEYDDYVARTVGKSRYGASLAANRAGLASGFAAAGRRGIREELGARSEGFLQQFQSYGMNRGVPLNGQFLENFRQATASGNIGYLQQQAAQLQGAGGINSTGQTMLTNFIQQLTQLADKNKNIDEYATEQARIASGGIDVSAMLTNGNFNAEMDKLGKRFEEAIKKAIVPAPTITIPTSVAITVQGANSDEMAAQVREKLAPIIDTLKQQLKSIQDFIGMKVPPKNTTPAPATQ